MNNAIYEKITNDFINSLNEGIVPWHQPWFGHKWAVSHTNGRPYSLLNQMLLGKGGEWLTFKQIQEEGGSIKKGCKAHYVVFWKIFPKYRKDEDGNETSEKIGTYAMLKYYNVWHITECEGIKEKYPAPDPNDNDPIESAFKIYTDYYKRERFDETNEISVGLFCMISEFNRESCYVPSTDTIYLPSIKLFESSEAYYSTLFHEMTHSTGAKHRLNRDGIVNNDGFGSESYSKEELIAELGAAFLCNAANLDPSKTFDNSAAYVKGWLSMLKDDPRLIVTAATKAEQATHYILTGEKPSFCE